DSSFVLGAKALEKNFEFRRPVAWIETEHAISFRRPVPDFSGGGRPRPTAGMAEPLCFREISFALALRRFRKFSLDGNAGKMRNMFNRPRLLRVEATWLAIVHSKRSDYFACGGEDRRGPTSPQRVRESQFAKNS